MRGLLVAVLILSGCSIGPRKLQGDCTWRDKDKMSRAQNSVLGASMVGLIGGFGTFLGSAVYASGHKKSDVMGTIGAAGFGAAFVSIPLGWYAMGAFEEVPAPFTLYKHCQDTVWKDPDWWRKHP